MATCGVATLVGFHAHPDDEAIACGGTLARAAAEGHRVVVVMATKGERGEVPDGLLVAGESVGDRRTEETLEAARVLGVDRVEFLGYADSGMRGRPENESPGCFWRADVEEAAQRLAAVLDDERADALTVYDERGVYGHPDHVQVHRVGSRAAQLAATPRVYEATVDRDHLAELLARAPELGIPPLPDVDGVDETMGVPGAVVTTRVDVSSHLQRKREAIATHASQRADASFFLSLAPEAFAALLGTECYVLQGAPAGTRHAWLLDGLGP